MKELTKMTRNRKMQATLAVLAAAIAVTVAAAPASAHVPATFTFPNGAKEVKSLTDGTQEIKIPGLGNVICTGVSYEGVAGGAQVTAITLKPTFSGCKFLEENYMVLMRDCTFLLLANGQMTISSSVGGDCVKFPILITREGKEVCEVTISEQTLTGVNYTNINANKEVTTSIASKGIEGEKGVNCAGSGAFNTGEYVKGNTILAGYDGATKKVMTWSATVP